MPSTTPTKNLPYPLGTDRVMDGDDQIRKLAQSVDNMVQGGVVAANIVTGGTSVTVALTFPVAYGAPPSVVVAPVAANASTNISVSVTSITTTGCTIAAVRGSSGTQSVQWLAVGPVAAVA